MDDANNVDLSKAFDLTGNSNDQMLKLYFRKAGLSDNIDSLTAEQKRAYIYDIVKSNKNPGYWKPKVLPQNPIAFNKTPIERESSITLDSIYDIPPASTTFDLDRYRQVKNNSNGVQNNLLGEQKPYAGGSLYERQFSQKQYLQNNVINSPPNSLPTTKLKTRKGKIIEIGGPTNFQHISGDMTRDMTKNTFDLSENFNNNTLKKYMIERGISEEDVSGLDCKDLVRRIVQSNYTWMPPQKQLIGNRVPPPPSETYVAAVPTPPAYPRNINISKGGAIVVAPPVLPASSAPSSEPIYDEVYEPIENTVSIRKHRTKPHSPPPPPPPPSPPQPSVSVNSVEIADHSTSKLLTNGAPLPSKPFPPPMPIKKTVRTQNSTLPAPPPPPPPPPSMPIEQPVRTQNYTTLPPPPPPMPIVQTVRADNCPPPPPPPPPSSIPSKLSEELRHPQITTESKVKTQFEPTQTGGEHDDRNAFLQSIRNGVTLKKVTSEDKPFKNGTPSVTKQSRELNDLPTPKKQVPLQHEKSDFMSELRNATLKRIKKLEDNPFASESEC